MDYVDAFSTVVKMTSVQILLSLATIHHWWLHQLDIKNAILNYILDEEVYMEQPPGFIAKGSVRRFAGWRKSLYSLKQYPRACFESFELVIQKFGLCCAQKTTMCFGRYRMRREPCWLGMWMIWSQEMTQKEMKAWKSICRSTFRARIPWITLRHWGGWVQEGHSFVTEKIYIRLIFEGWDVRVQEYWFSDEREHEAATRFRGGFLRMLGGTKDWWENWTPWRWPDRTSHSQSV